MGASSRTYVDADWAGGFTAPFPINWRGGDVAVQVVITGTPNVDIQSTNVDLNAGDSAASTDWFVDASSNAGVTASKWVTFTGKPRFIRFKVNSGSGSITIRTTQSDV